MSEEAKYWWDNNPTCVSGLKSSLETWSGVYNVLEPEVWCGTYTGGQVYIKELNYEFDPSGSFTEDVTFCGNVSYWREDRFKPPIPGHDNGLPTIKWEAPQDE